MVNNTKRILSDYIKITSNNNEQTYYFCDTEQNINHVIALIVGPPDTPYENGFYFFHIEYTKEFPRKPPNVKLITLDNNVRFNPNLYTDGKVCLSILNTWNGPSWVASYNLETILQSILGCVMTDKPLINEPGCNFSDEAIKAYNNCIDYYNHVVAVLKVFNNPDSIFNFIKNTNLSYFQNIIDTQIMPKIKEIFIKKFNMYEKKLTKLITEMEGKTISSSFGIKEISNCSYNKILTDFKQLYNNIITENSELLKFVTVPSDTVDTSTII